MKHTLTIAAFASLVCGKAVAAEPRYYQELGNGRYLYAQPLSPQDHEAGVTKRRIWTVIYWGMSSQRQLHVTTMDGIGVGCKVPCRALIVSLDDGGEVSRPRRPFTIADDVFADIEAGLLKPRQAGP
mgnify:FL=1